ncbi:unnamed protein product [Ascophyllum nodosum]
MTGCDFTGRSPWQAWTWCTGNSVAFVASLYLVPQRLRRLPRSDPSQASRIRARFAAVSATTFASVVGTRLLARSVEDGVPFRKWIGIGVHHLGPALVLPLLLTCCLFLGPLVTMAWMVYTTTLNEVSHRGVAKPRTDRMPWHLVARGELAKKINLDKGIYSVIRNIVAGAGSCARSCWLPAGAISCLQRWCRVLNGIAWSSTLLLSRCGGYQSSPPPPYFPLSSFPFRSPIPSPSPSLSPLLLLFPSPLPSPSCARSLVSTPIPVSVPVSVPAPTPVPIPILGSFARSPPPPFPLPLCPRPHYRSRAFSRPRPRSLLPVPRTRLLPRYNTRIQTRGLVNEAVGGPQVCVFATVLTFELGPMEGFEPPVSSSLLTPRTTVFTLSLFTFKPARPKPQSV